MAKTKRGWIENEIKINTWSEKGNKTGNIRDSSIRIDWSRNKVIKILLIDFLD
jgi:hypothetical protein